MKLNIIGLGRLGKTLAKLFVSQNLTDIQSIQSTTRESVLKFIREIGQGQACSNILEMPRAPLTMITTPDDYIEKTALILSKYLDIQSGDIFFHCSGLLPSAVLQPIRDRGGIIASVHPLKSFTHHIQENYLGTYCAIEGDEEAVQLLQHLFKMIGFTPFAINRDKKALYHAGAVFASNYLVTLLYQATSCVEASGVDPKIAKEIVLSLMQGTLNNLKEEEASDALTGPLARGDVETIAKHLAELGDSKVLYQELAKATLPLTQHTEETLLKLIQLLD